jgi:hypothetical protein
MTYRFDSTPRNLTVADVLAKDKTGHYSHNCDLFHETELINTQDGYAIKVGGFYSLSELALLVKNLSMLNQLQGK